MNVPSPAHPFDLAGRRALVTGSARGLGLEIARALHRAGAAVVLNGRDAEALSRVAATFPADGAAVETADFDVADADARQTALSALTAGDRAIDIVVSNVGVRRRGPIGEIEPADFSALLEANLVAPFALARSLAPPMAARGFGRFVTVCSIAGPRARPGDAAYIAAKGGLAALTRALAAEFGAAGITANGIAPGFFATETNAAMVDDPGVARFVKERIPLARWGRPEEIAGAAVFLASDAASYVNGHVLTVDGGLSIAF